MEFKTSNEKIWLENENGAAIAFVDFPEFEPGKVEVTHTVVDPSLRGREWPESLWKRWQRSSRRTAEKPRSPAPTR
jgi:predicted GNAT family acetyltransferase